MAFDEHVSAAHALKGLLDVGDEVPQIGLMIFLPKDGIELVDIDSRTFPIDEVSEELF